MTPPYAQARSAATLGSRRTSTPMATKAAEIRRTKAQGPRGLTGSEDFLRRGFGHGGP
jgi:hypothetical protein